VYAHTHAHTEIEKIILDVREFMSSLPSILHKHGSQVGSV
jgi:ERCC4-type nuclease